MTSSPGCTCAALRKLTRTVSRLYDLQMAGVGLKTSQFSLLKHIDYAALPMAELAIRFGSDRTTLTRNLKPLIDAGWVVLTPGTDARQRIVRLTDAGCAKIVSARQTWRTAQTELEHTLGMDLVQSLHADLRTAMQRLTPLLEEKLHATVE